MKLLLWAAIVLAVIWILRSKKSSPKVDSAMPPHSTEDAAEVMLRCAHCKTYFPASEAVFDSSHTVFCSVEHRRQHAAS